MRFEQQCAQGLSPTGCATGSETPGQPDNSRKYNKATMKSDDGFRTEFRHPMVDMAQMIRLGDHYCTCPVCKNRIDKFLKCQWRRSCHSYRSQWPPFLTSRRPPSPAPPWKRTRSRSSQGRPGGSPRRPWRRKSRARARRGWLASPPQQPQQQQQQEEQQQQQQQQEQQPNTLKSYSREIKNNRDRDEWANGQRVTWNVDTIVWRAILF